VLEEAGGSGDYDHAFSEPRTLNPICLNRCEDQEE